MPPTLPGTKSPSRGQVGQSTKVQNAPVSPVNPPGGQTAAEQTPTMAELLREMQETNRLLRALVSQKTVGQGLAVDEALSQDMTGLETHSPPPSPLPSPSPSPPEPGLVKAKTRQLFEDLAHAVFGSADREHMKLFRDKTISYLSSCQLNPGPQFEAWEFTPLGERPWLSEEEMEQLRRQWPDQFDLDRLTASISRNAGWIRAKNAWQNGVVCAYPFLYGLGRMLVPANAILDDSPKADTVARKMSCANLVSPGSLWLFTTPLSTTRGLTLGRLALIAAVALMNPNDDSDTILHLVHDFCAAWNSTPVRTLFQEFAGWRSGSCNISYQLAVRCFSHFNSHTAVDDFVPYVRCHRQAGKFPTFLADEYNWSFAERRMSVLCRWSGHGNARSFTIVLLSDFKSVQNEASMSLSNVLFADWRDRGFTVGGGNAGYHMLQSVVHRILIFWEKEWSNCLRMLGCAANTTLQDILSDETSNDLMFDSSYARSRIYFKTLGILRIFGDAIRETGRDVQEMDPRRLLQGSLPQGGSFLRAGWDVRFFLKEDPAMDKALWENWRILSEFQRKAEERLLLQIAAKTEEIKSLRDGLFNATSLREASRSTTINRYIIVFTIFTVLYLPLGFTTALFGTPLFEAEEQAETVERFKVSTIIVCVITYGLAFLLVWVAGKWDAAGSAYHSALGLWISIWEKVKRKSIDKLARRISEKSHVETDDTVNRGMRV
ncbi:hypothetical protein C8A01DRAFT_18865 [Parachaetomium inaequale]|uniref:Uncharacterized protein n=1 Tax=Parachaetomium inaequale TaxID=2588326 RepID=A0AAN6PDF6_9PEZI|nr:hypothetical protein C8A01DRAFT_18865 [Parachaetomium inaequale]